jgi:hypothetical protein
MMMIFFDGGGPLGHYLEEQVKTVFSKERKYAWRQDLGNVVS